MDKEKEFLEALGHLLERYPEFAAAFTVSRPETEIKGLRALTESKRCCRWGQVPGDGYVCLEWCED